MTRLAFFLIFLFSATLFIGALFVLWDTDEVSSEYYEMLYQGSYQGGYEIYYEGAYGYGTPYASPYISPYPYPGPSYGYPSPSYGTPYPIPYSYPYPTPPPYLTPYTYPSPSYSSPSGSPPSVSVSYSSAGGPNCFGSGLDGTISWSVSNATSCTSELYGNVCAGNSCGGWSGGSPSPSGGSIGLSFPDTVRNDGTFHIECTGPGGTRVADAYVCISGGGGGPPPPPPSCGNGVWEAGEACDSGSTNGVCPAACSVACTLNTCQPDLVAEGLASSPGPMIIGQSASFSATIRNIDVNTGAGASATSLRIDVGDDGSWDIAPADQLTGGIAPGATEVETWGNVWTATPGTHRFIICADTGSAIAESNETNNCTTQSFTVFASDYIVQGLEPPPPNYVGGNSVTFRATVVNQGTYGAPVNSFTRLRIDINNNGSWDLVISPDQVVGQLGAGGGSAPVEWSNAWTAVNGRHRYEVCADATNAILESDEGNNCATRTFDVAPAAPTAVTATGACVANLPLVSLTWSPGSLTGADFYIERCQGTTCTPASPEIAIDASSPYPDASVANNLEYRYRIRAHDITTGLFSGYSNVLQATPRPFCPPPPQADLVSENLSISTASPSVGQPVTFSGQVRNQGSGTAGPSNARFWLDLGNDGIFEIDLGSRAVPSLDPDISVPVTSNTWTAVSGTHQIELYADGDIPDDVLESDEANNWMTLVFTVGAAPQADLVAQNISMSPSTPTLGGPAVVFTGQIRNQGALAAGASTSQFRIDTDDNGSWDITLGTPATGALCAGCTESENSSPAWTPVVGNHRIELCADIANAVVESDESTDSNCVTRLFSVSSGYGTPPPSPDAPLLNFTASPTSVSIGDTSTLTWSITNQATACVAPGCTCSALGDWSGAKAVSGSQIQGPYVTARAYNYLLTCTGPGGSTTQTASVSVGCDDSCPQFGARQCNGPTHYYVCSPDPITGCLSWTPQPNGTPCGTDQFCRSTASVTTNGQCVDLPGWIEIPPPMSWLLNRTSAFLSAFGL